MTATTTAYTFDNSVVEAEDQLASLQAFQDPITTKRILELNLPITAQCWEIGAGGGSITAWLATHIAPAGHVVATDINTSRLHHLTEVDNVTIVEHNVTTLTPPPGGPFDLIHARLVLLHLAEREQILRHLVASLAPGGWLVLEEFDCTQPLPILRSTRSEADQDLFARVTNTIIDVLEANGADMQWAQVVYARMIDAGLVDVHTITHSESWAGASTGARLHAANTVQLAPQLHAAGLTDADLQRFRDILADPHHTAMSYLLVSTRGRRPLR